MKPVILFENPANSVLSSLVNDNAPNNLKLALLNVNGQIIHHWQYLQASSHYVFDVSGFETGMYYLKIYNESFQQTKPLQIIH